MGNHWDSPAFPIWSMANGNAIRSLKVLAATTRASINNSAPGGPADAMKAERDVNPEGVRCEDLDQCAHNSTKEIRNDTPCL